jgi:ubiquinone biosynthesis protein COQ4
MNIFTKVWLLTKSLYGMLGLARNPQNTNYVFMIGNAQDTLANQLRLEGKIADPYNNPEIKQLWQDNYHPAKYDLAALKLLPNNTLGYHYAQHMISNNLDPDYYTDTVPVSPMHYLRLRIRKTHDVWHLITGFDTSDIGEIGLQGFYMAQFTNGQSALILAGGIMRSVFSLKYNQLEQYLASFIKGYNQGKLAKPLLPVKWEELWEQDINQVKNDYLSL